MSTLIEKEASFRAISRLCHFTQSRNLVHIASHPDGIKSTRALKDDQMACFTATDNQRIDGFTDHICCSIEYPNAWYLSKVETQEVLFKDWVVLLIAPHYLWHDETHFCARNAAAGAGAHVVKSLAGFQSMFASSVVGAGGYSRNRGETHLKCSPTDDQAEVLIKSKISLKDVLGVAVKNEKQAKNEIARLRHAGINENVFKFVVSPVLFDKHKLSSAIRTGKKLSEKFYP